MLGNLQRILLSHGGRWETPNLSTMLTKSIQEFIPEKSKSVSAININSSEAQICKCIQK